MAKLNRTTFYANYIDIYDLVDKIKDKMVKDFFEIYKEETISKMHSYDFLKLFYHKALAYRFYQHQNKLLFAFSFYFTLLENIFFIYILID